MIYIYYFITNTDPVDCLPVDLDAAVAELEAQIEECVPLFTGNSDPVGDLQGLLQGLQSDLAECLRNRWGMCVYCCFLILNVKVYRKKMV